MRALLSLIFVATLVGCDSHVAPPQTVQAIKLDAMSQVISLVKQEVGSYMAYRNSPQGRLDASLATTQLGVAAIVKGPAPNPAPAILPPCGSGNIDFDLDSVKIDMTTTTDTTVNAEVSAQVPVVPLTLGPDGKISKENKDTQELVFTEYPLVDPSYTTAAPMGALGNTLKSLRSALLTGAATHPCFRDFDPNNPKQEHTFTLGFTVTGELTGTLGLKFVIVNTTAGIDNKSISGNTLTVSFRQAGLDALPHDPKGHIPTAALGSVGLGVK
jgi:hypothetical protein